MENNYKFNRAMLWALYLLDIGLYASIPFVSSGNKIFFGFTAFLLTIYLSGYLLSIKK